MSFLSGLYQSSVESIAEDVSLLQRKFSYVARQEDAPIRVRDDLDGLWSGNSPNPSDLNEWSAKVQALYQKLDNVQSDKDAALSVFPSNADRRSDLFISITDPDVLKPLVEHGTLVITPAWYHGKLDSDPRTASYPLAYVANSPGFNEVRLTHIQPRIYGARTAHDQLSIDVVVSPRTVLLTGSGKRLEPHLFDNHHHRSTKIVQNLAYGPDETSNDDIGRSIDGNLRDHHLDAVGLYAEYIKLTVEEAASKEDDNKDLDRSGINEVRIYFKGLARSN